MCNDSNAKWAYKLLNVYLATYIPSRSYLEKVNNSKCVACTSWQLHFHYSFRNKLFLIFKLFLPKRNSGSKIFFVAFKCSVSQVFSSFSLLKRILTKTKYEKLKIISQDLIWKTFRHVRSDRELLRVLYRNVCSCN